MSLTRDGTKGRLFLALFLLLLFALGVAPADKNATLPDVPVGAVLPAQPYVPNYFVDYDSVRMVRCDTWLGTGTVYAPNRMISAYHVAAKLPPMTQCSDYVTGTKLTVVYQSPEDDIIIFSLPTNGMNYVHASCEGFHAGQLYRAHGFRFGKSAVDTFLTATNIVTADDFKSNTGQRWPHLRQFTGDVYPGMSGGPLFDMNGNMIGTVVSTNNAGVATSRDLRDTVLCRPN